ncbi:hypothetical protein [Fluviispira vulneris]|uniref:hypothetical protein n=1 Tax=Fluviispira vulneris TaxID=2763012 RepID=UPI0016474521|nr:hypothetical protein [Fluviispira vulneris]
MKRYSLCGLILSVHFFIGCGTEKQNVVPTINVTADQVLFTSDDYGKFNDLYSIDLATKKFNTLRHIDASSDTGAYQINNAAGELEHFYHVEKFSQKNNTRVTHYSSTYRQNENVNFPINTKDLILHKGKLLGIGYDDRKIIKTDLNLNEEMPATFIKGLEHDINSVSNSDKNITSILIANERVFVVSAGKYEKDDNNTDEKKPKVYLLNQELNAVEKSWSMQYCFNAFSMQRVENNSKLLISCNPNYGTGNNNPSFILIDANKINIDKNIDAMNEQSFLDKDAEEIVLLNQSQRSDYYFVKVNGISLDKKQAFITEYKRIGFGWEAKGEVENSYWYNIETKEITPTKNVAGHVIYNKKHNMYLFSCFLKNNVCEKDKFVLAKDMYGTDPELIDVKIKGIFSGFAKVLN